MFAWSASCFTPRTPEASSRYAASDHLARYEQLQHSTCNACARRHLELLLLFCCGCCRGGFVDEIARIQGLLSVSLVAESVYARCWRARSTCMCQTPHAYGSSGVFHVRRTTCQRELLPQNWTLPLARRMSPQQSRSLRTQPCGAGSPVVAGSSAGSI